MMVWAGGEGTCNCHWVRNVHAPLKSSSHIEGALPDDRMAARTAVRVLKDLCSEGQRKAL